MILKFYRLLIKLTCRVQIQNEYVKKLKKLLDWMLLKLY